MSETELFQIFTGKLNALGLEYMVTGSVAGTLYGEPRVTHDVDIAMRLAGSRVRDFVQHARRDSLGLVRHTLAVTRVRHRSSSGARANRLRSSDEAELGPALGLGSLVGEL